MNHIDELISKLAPHGVRHVRLSEVATYSPTRVDAKNLDKSSFVGVDNLVSGKGGRVDANYLPNTKRLTGYEPGDILLGNIRPYLQKIWRATSPGGCSGDVLAIRIQSEFKIQIDSEFLYYLLSADKFFAYDMQHSKGAKMPRGNKTAILDFRIPVPPLKVQLEIVRLFDQFTQLEAELETELETELEARRQQYEHYQRQIFADAVTRGARPVQLGDVGHWYGGGTPSKAKSEYWTGGTIPWISPKDMGVATVTGTADHITEAAVAGSATRLVPPNAVAIVVRSSILDHTLPVAYVPTSSALNQDMKAVIAIEGILPRYLFHTIRASRSELLRQARRAGGSVASLESRKLWKFEIPVPNLAEQESICELFDELNMLMDDLKIDLLAELAARRVQFEYYRDRLLTFEEAAA